MFFSLMESSFWLGTIISASTHLLSSAMPWRARFILYSLSNSKGFVTTPTVSIPFFFAISAITGAAPVPVPPPIPAATNTRDAPFSASSISSLFSFADSAATGGFPPAPRPLVVFLPICTRSIALPSLALSAATSVFTMIKSTPSTLFLTMFSTAFPPPPPTPTTFILTSRSNSSSSNSKLIFAFLRFIYR